jgi:hypothetical protein
MINNNMKTLPIILSTLLLSGCALSTPPKQFDSTLYDHLVTLSVDTEQAELSCGKPAISQQIFTLNRESKQITKYTQYAAKDVNASVILMDKAITEMNSVYQAGTPSTAYCQLKLKIINADLDIILNGIGGKSK